MVDEVAEVKPAAGIDAWTSRFIIVSLGLALLICVASMLLPSFFGINLSTVMGERFYNLAQAIVTGLFALFSPLVASALKAGK